MERANALCRAGKKSAIREYATGLQEAWREGREAVREGEEGREEGGEGEEAREEGGGGKEKKVKYTQCTRCCHTIAVVLTSSSQGLADCHVDSPITVQPELTGGRNVWILI